jgi:hypothetical protein
LREVVSSVGGKLETSASTEELQAALREALAFVRLTRHGTGAEIEIHVGLRAEDFESLIRVDPDANLLPAVAERLGASAPQHGATERLTSVRRAPYARASAKAGSSDHWCTGRPDDEEWADDAG